VPSPVAGMGVAYGARLLGSGKQYVHKNLASWFPTNTLRTYFQVNNSYVYHKLRLLLLPFLHRGTWARQTQHNDDGTIEFMPPRSDVLAPDLYIPTMAFVTYVLVVAFVLGVQGKFTPEILGLTATTGLVTLLLELALIKFLFYLSGFPSIPFLDMVSYL